MEYARVDFKMPKKTMETNWRDDAPQARIWEPSEENPQRSCQGEFPKITLSQVLQTLPPCVEDAFHGAMGLPNKERSLSGFPSPTLIGRVVDPSINCKKISRGSMTFPLGQTAGRPNSCFMEKKPSDSNPFSSADLIGTGSHGMVVVSNYGRMDDTPICRKGKDIPEYFLSGKEEDVSGNYLILEFFTPKNGSSGRDLLSNSESEKGITPPNKDLPQ
ncbi:hypothetical protein U1Q18_009027 [Sarracenia purpurea var. burkii]